MPLPLTLSRWGYCGSPLFLHTVFLTFLLSRGKEFLFNVNTRNTVFPKLLASFLIWELTFLFSEMAAGSSETERHFASVQALCC